MPSVTAISHVTLTVTDLERSATWYARVLGLKRVRDLAGATWRRVLMANEGVVIGLQQHDSTAVGDSFNEVRVGLDHLSIACESRADVEKWLAHLDAEGVAHSPISAPPSNVATVKDPDGIALEFFAANCTCDAAEDALGDVMVDSGHRPSGGPDILEAGQDT